MPRRLNPFAFSAPKKEYKWGMLSVSGLDLGAKNYFSHRFAAGAITVVVGHNNSGKTRLARAIAGLETSPPGTLRVDGVDISHQDARARSVGLVYQAFVNYPNWNVFNNVASPLHARGVDAAGIGRTVRQLADRLRIGDLLDRFPHELSGGQQQRVAIARALAKGGRVLVMDEPLVNLDYKLREELESQLRELLLDRGPVVVYTTSDPRGRVQPRRRSRAARRPGESAERSSAGRVPRSGFGPRRRPHEQSRREPSGHRRGASARAPLGSPPLCGRPPLRGGTGGPRDQRRGNLAALPGRRGATG